MVERQRKSPVRLGLVGVVVILAFWRGLVALFT